MLSDLVAEKLFAGRVISSRFRLDRELGRGGMGTVWEGRHLALETQVAIKFLKSELSMREDIRARFAREATSAARIRSPNVVGVLDSGFTEDDFAFIVMELLHGEDLGRRLARVGSCSLRETCSLVTQIARGLAKAHAVGIVHRDLKPENLFVTNDEEHTVKILDFGIAKAFGPEAATHKTDTGQLLGTPMYMSPEQALGRAIDNRSDLYSLAVVAYRCLAGRAPFEHAAHGEMIVAVSMEAPPPPSQFNPALATALDAWFAGMFAKDPSARACQTASELGESFERACTESLDAAPSPPAKPSGKPPGLNLPGATLSGEDGSGVPSAEEVATTVLAPHFFAPASERGPRAKHSRRFLAILALASTVGASLAFLHQRQQSASITLASAPAAVAPPSVPADQPTATTTPVEAPPALAADTTSLQRPSATKALAKLGLGISPRPTASSASVAAAEGTRAPGGSATGVTAMPVPAPQLEPTARAQPDVKPQALGIDRDSPW